LASDDVMAESLDEERKIAATEAELQECCSAISAELEKVHMYTNLLTYCCL